MSARQDRAAKRYARAIFETVEPARYDELLQLLEGLSVAWKTSTEMRAIMTDPSLRSETKLSLVEAVAGTCAPHCSKEEKSFLSLLVTAGRFPLIPVIRDEVVLMVREFRKALSLVVTSATEIAGDEKNAIADNLRTKLGAAVGIEWMVDPEIIGGLVIRLGDKLLDRSLAGMLQQMKSHITA